MQRTGTSYREYLDPEFAEMLKRKHELYNCKVCRWFDRGASIGGLCTHTNTQELKQSTHKECLYKEKRGG